MLAGCRMHALARSAGYTFAGRRVRSIAPLVRVLAGPPPLPTLVGYRELSPALRARG